VAYFIVGEGPSWSQSYMVVRFTTTYAISPYHQ